MIYFGYTTMTHGLKGELKLYTNFSLKEKVLQKGFPIIIENQKHVLTSARTHQNHYLITIDSLEDINLVENFRNKEIYIDEAILPSDLVIAETLIDYEIKEKSFSLGKVQDILYNKSGILLEVRNREKKFYIPYQEHFIEQVDQHQKIIFVQNVKDSFG